MNKIKSHFRFNKQERSGIFFLLLIIVILQGAYFYIKTKPFGGEAKVTVDMAMQTSVDSLRFLALQEKKTKIFPFNPNYISDYRGYALGMSTEELDKLFAFRKTGKFINSASEFQEVTQISDSMLTAISPYFNFPKWTQRNGETKSTRKSARTMESPVEIIDLNSATAEQLKKVRGIGDKLSGRIIKFRDRLGGFLINEQLNDVYGLESDVVQRVLDQFKVIQPPKVLKININNATAEQLARLIYIGKDLAKKIVTFREQNGPFDSFEVLKNIESFPVERIDRIKLYLTL
ncbi:ComEA family DNA-binding protein [Flagellimonas onchidii]|uniref:ComEA family DNA-binding protein n=1 Tax=Flagellimonas onchidii TaxID=2562684 RepID=UPI0010A659FE|nr:helix-hairpin-helix domain-containing protein [Allomuricauda onchidii]